MIKIFVVSFFVAVAIYLVIPPEMVFAEADSFITPKGQIAAGQKSHLILVTALTLVAIIPVFVLLPLILIKYRRSGSNSDYKPNWDFSLPLEIAMWGVPVVLVSIMSWHLWQSTHELDPYRPIVSDNPTVNVQVVGLDWKWLFIYPDLGIATVGEMGMPNQHPVAMTLTSDTVMQSFIISALAGQIYVMAGMTTKLHVMADQIGVFEGENLQYNGTGFVGQKFEALSMSPDDFEVWVQKVKASAIVLNQKSYNTLAMQGSAKDAHAALASDATPAGAVYFTLPDANIFHKIVMKYHNGSALPRDQQPGTSDFNSAVKGETPQ